MHHVNCLSAAGEWWWQLENEKGSFAGQGLNENENDDDKDDKKQDDIDDNGRLERRRTKWRCTVDHDLSPSPAVFPATQAGRGDAAVRVNTKKSQTNQVRNKQPL